MIRSLAIPIHRRVRFTSIFVDSGASPTDFSTIGMPPPRPSPKMEEGVSESLQPSPIMGEGVLECLTRLRHALPPQPRWNSFLTSDILPRIMPNDHTLRVYDSMFGLLSSEENPTPLVRLNKVVPFEHTQVFAKLEWYNPFGAVKDRIAANMIRDAEERGLLEAGKKLVEATSGNTGLGLAMVGNLKGYPLQTPLSAAIPLEKRTVRRFFGTDVVEMDDLLCLAP